MSKQYICTVCQYIYNPTEHNGVSFEELPDDFECPICHVGKEMFEETEN